MIGTFFAIPPGGLGPPQDALIADVYADEARMSVFLEEGVDHVMLESPDAHVAVDGTAFRPWVLDWLAGVDVPDAYRGGSTWTPTP